MSLMDDLDREASAWTIIGGKPSPGEFEVRSMGLVSFLELISLADFKFRYFPGDKKTHGIEVRHKILMDWIAHLKKLKEESGKKIEQAP